jgi:hypothetical protein
MSAHVFLSHSTADKPAVEELARRLHDKEGIQAWLDKWNLIPGASWQPAIEDALKECESCAVFVGPEGLGPWQREEMSVAINRRVCDSEQRFCDSGFTARSEARKLVGISPKYYMGRIPRLNRRFGCLPLSGLWDSRCHAEAWRIGCSR